MKYFLLTLLCCATFVCVKAQDVILNSGFGNNGTVTKSPDKSGNIFFENGRQVIELPDGKLLVVFECNGNTSMTRYLPNGTIDRSYGKEGYSDPIAYCYQAYTVRTPDGKIIMVATTYHKDTTNFLISRFNDNGQLDSSFGKSGTTLIPMVNLNDQLRAITLQKDNKVLILVQPNSSLNIKQAYVVQLLQDGTMDVSFGNKGFLWLDVPGITAVSAIAVNGASIIVGANSANGSGSDFAVLQYLENGKPDLSFGSNGVVKVDISNGDQLRALTIQPDGKILLGGNTGNNIWSSNNFTVIRFLQNGRRDSTFNKTSIASVNFDFTGCLLTSVLADAKGQITVAGLLNYGSNGLGFARFTSDGILDKSFGEGGKKVLSTSHSSEEMNAGILKKDGSFVGVGYYAFNSVFDYLIVQLKPDGQPDLNFGPNGEVISYYPGKMASFGSPKLLPDGKLLVQYNAFGDTASQGLIRLLADGTTDMAFGDKGLLKTTGYHFQSLKDRRIVTFETVTNDTNYIRTIIMSRYTKDGKPDLTFGKNGRKALSSHVNNFLNSVSFQQDSKLLLVGDYSNINWNAQYYMMRLDPDGNPDVQFGTGGEVLFNTAVQEYPTQSALMPDGKILLSGIFMVSNFNFQFFLRRFNTDGSIDESFGNKGAIFGNSGLFSSISTPLVQPDGKILTGLITTFDNNHYTSQLLRYNVNGTLDSTFGDNGAVQNVSPSALLKDGKILIASWVPNESGTDAVFSRLNSNGSTDTTFGKNGKSVIKLNGRNNFSSEVVIKDNKLFASGEQSDGFDYTALLVGFLINDQSSVALTCTKSKTAPTDPGRCSAVVRGIDPVLTPSGAKAVVKYNLSGATSSIGTGTVSGLIFNKGITTVTYSLQNDSTKSCTFTVTVNDAEPPQINGFNVSTPVLWPPDHTMKDVFLSYNSSDNCGIVSYTVTVTSNEPDASSEPGDKPLDWEVVDAHHVRLRAERLGSGNGRVYTITLVCTDAAGNITFRSTSVTVPKNMSAIIKGIYDEMLKLVAFPNPSHTNFILRIEGANADEKINVKVVDAIGRVVEVKTITVSQIIQLGSTYRPGLYYVEVTQGSKKVSGVLIKQTQ